MKGRLPCASKNWIHISSLDTHIFTPKYEYMAIEGFPGDSVVKNLPANAGDTDLIPGSKRSPEEGTATHSRILAWRILMDRGAWQATVPGVAKSLTCLIDYTHT